jgi:xylulokinase
MIQPNILAIDVGTSEVKAALVSHDGHVQACARSANAVLHPRPDWAEQDPNGWWHAICSATRELWKTSEHRPQDVSGLVFSCQMFGVLPVDVDGKPLMNAMIWLDTRSREHARQIVSGFPSFYGYGVLRALKWLRICNGAPSRAGRDVTSKFVWLREERPEVWERTHKLLDVKDYLLLRCTGQALTTHDLASGGWLYRTKKGQLGWSDEILRMLDLTTEKLPKVIRSAEVAGELLDEAAADLGLPAGIPVVAGAGDVQSCAIGAGAARDKELHLCLGTSSWLAAHLDDRALSPFAATGTLCAAEYGKYLLIATQETAGASQEWLRRKVLGDSLDYEQINRLVESSEPGARGVSFFPWLMGERVPVDDPAVRGAFVNLGLDHDRSDLLRAVYEGVGFNVKWAHRVVERMLGGRTRSVRIAGGGAQSDVWCQIMADILDTEIRRVRNPQFATVRGAGLIALRALGELDRLDESADLVETTASFEPKAENRALYDERFALYLDYYKRNRRWFRRLNAGTGILAD